MEQADLARLTGLSRATISAAENGHRQPSRASLAMWAMATGVSRTWLIAGTDPDAQDAADARARLEAARFNAVMAVIRAHLNPTAAGYADAADVMEVMSAREHDVQERGEWVATSALDHPELDDWCRKYLPRLAEDLERARAVVAKFANVKGPDRGGSGPSLPDLDSNQEPIGYEFDQSFRQVASIADYRERRNADGIARSLETASR